MKSLLFLFIILIPFAVVSAEPTPIVYSRILLKIIPTSQPVSTTKEQKENAKKSVAELPPTPRNTKTYTVNVRPLQFLAQRDFISHQPFTDKGGMLILIDPPEVATLQSSNLLGTVDVLFISPDGIIIKIIPNVSLSALEEPISTEKPVRAFVFLKGQTAKTDHIQPGDRIENSLFKSNPLILDMH